MIVQFKPRRANMNSNRVEAMIKGQIESYECNSCGKEFEVLFEQFPERCPHCNMRIDWGNSEK